MLRIYALWTKILECYNSQPHNLRLAACSHLWGLAMATLTFAGATLAFAAATQAKLMATQAMYFQKFF